MRSTMNKVCGLLAGSLFLVTPAATFAQTPVRVGAPADYAPSIPLPYYDGPLDGARVLQRTYSAAPIQGSKVTAAPHGSVAESTIYGPATVRPAVSYPYYGQPATRPWTPVDSRWMYRPVVGATAPSSNTYLGQGILGQPKAYVSGQPLRNFLRYLTP